ncbi:MAG: RIP metalloprotease RseP [Massilia sp.]
MSFIQGFWWGLVAIGPLILFHELGHYVVARLCGVKVLRFSIGLGKVLWSRRVGPDQTEWAISAIPLGGYVKFLDDRDPATAATKPEDLPREFTRQSVWRRIAIVAAGPIANFILAIAVFAGLYMHGVPEVSTRLRPVAETSASWQAGLRGDDNITAVNGVGVPSWTDLRVEVIKAALDKAELRLDVTQPHGGHYSATVPASVTSQLKVDGDVMEALGLDTFMGPAVVRELIPGSPAQAAGVRLGDVLTRIDGKPLRDARELVETIQKIGVRPTTLAVTRDGAELEVAITPRRDPESGRVVIGVKPAAERERIIVKAGLRAALYKATVGTWDQALMQLKMIGKIVTGALSWKNVTGIITIADYASQTAHAGAVVFLSFVASISISLGVMNLLPIPVLDGGHLLYYSLEVLTGRPLPERFTEYAQRAGVVLLMMLMSLAIFNDVGRYL